MKRVINLRNNKVLVENLERASSMKDRLIGLMGRKTLPVGHGLLLERSGNSIHTCFMNFPIDVAFISKSGQVKYFKTKIKPWRIVVAPILALTDCLELPAGTLENHDIHIGDTLRVED